MAVVAAAISGLGISTSARAQLNAPAVAVAVAAAADADAATRARDLCTSLAAATWPRHAAERRQLLQRFEAARPGCITHAPFLAALGALWLDEGEPAQALIWLERSLLLDAQQLGALADHALALAALGDPSARDELAARWQQRTDVPPALRARLAMQPTVRTTAAAAQSASAQWLVYRELTLVRGYETNLDHSPRLDEITLTPPGGAIDLPLLEPLVPRRGAATALDLSFQLARLSASGWVWQTGLLASGRHAEDERQTDWHHLQWAGSVSRRWGPWRAQAQLSATDVGGASDDRYRLARSALALEREAMGCTYRVSLEHERREHKLTPRTNGRTSGGVLGSQCALFVWPTWTWGLALRSTADRPSDAERPGGTQRQTSAGLRLGGPLPASFRLDASLRQTRLVDDEGYNELLANGARRRVEQTALSLELSRPFGGAAGNGTDWVLQAQRTVQRSNISLFAYQGASVFGGLRVRW